LNEINGIYL
jgi:RuvB-like protein 1 (pontin 52)